MVTTALGFTPYNSTNPSGYITGITSGNVTTALGFTPYNATNPSGYISNVTTALGYTPANQDNTILYHTLKYFTTTTTISTSGTSVTISAAQFTAFHIGMKLTILGESRIITAYTSTTQVTVATAYSTNYSSVSSADWGVYNKMLNIDNGSPVLYYYNSTTAVKVTNDNGISTANVQGSNFGIYAGESVFSNNYVFRISSTSSQFGTKDIGFRRNSAGVFEIFDGITATGLLANRRDLLVRNVKASSLTLDLAPFTITGSNNTLQTASTAVVGINYVGGSRQWATGNITAQSENVWGATTYSFVGASTITNAYGNEFFAPVAGTNCTITNNFAALFNGNVRIGSTGQLIEIKQTATAPTYIQTGSSSSVFRLNAGSKSLIFETYGTDQNYFTSYGGNFRIRTGDALPIEFYTTNVKRLTLLAGGSLLFAEANDIQTGTTTGTKIGTGTTQKIAFWNATPIVQPTTSVTASTFVANTSMILNDSATFDGYTIGQVVKALRNMGLLA